MARKRGMLSGFLEKQRFKIAKSFLSGKVLDVGCRQGGLRHYLADSSKYVGIDVLQQPADDFSFFRRSALNNLSDLGKFDSIALLAVIEHVSDCNSLLLNLYACLNKKGVLVVTTPSKAGNALHHYLAKLGLTSAHDAQDHKNIFSIDDLVSIIESAGFDVVKSRQFLFGGNQLVVGVKH